MDPKDLPGALKFPIDRQPDAFSKDPESILPPLEGPGEAYTEQGFQVKPQARARLLT